MVGSRKADYKTERTSHVSTQAPWHVKSVAVQVVSQVTCLCILEELHSTELQMGCLPSLLLPPLPCPITTFLGPWRLRLSCVPLDFQKGSCSWRMVSLCAALFYSCVCQRRKSKCTKPLDLQVLRVPYTYVHLKIIFQVLPN